MNANDKFKPYGSNMIARAVAWTVAWCLVWAVFGYLVAAMLG
jgi:hypothetical protein